MFDAESFFDYCVQEKCLENSYETTVKTLYKFGYRTIAVNQILDTTELESKKKKKKGETVDLVPEPLKIVSVEGCENLKILNRLTIVFSNQEVIPKVIKSPNYKKFHIIAVLPTTVPATLFTCSSLDGDIFCFNPENKSNLKRNRKIFKQLIDRGYHLEIPYSPAIEDTTKRKNIIHTAHLYHSFIKSRNIIISSSASSLGLIRNPYDVISLALIFGLNEQQAKNSITHEGRRVYINSVGRRHGKAVMFVENIETKKSSEDSEVVCIIDDDEDMDTDQPAPKKARQ